MPKRLNRKNYGWSYTFGISHRTPSKKYKTNYDLIKWNNIDTTEWDEKQIRFGKAKTKIFS